MKGRVKEARRGKVVEETAERAVDEMIRECGRRRRR